jgi:hypothetical protein
MPPATSPVPCCSTAPVPYSLTGVGHGPVRRELARAPARLAPPAYNTRPAIACSPMTTPKIQTIIRNFVAELTAALSEASHNAIAEALGGESNQVRSTRGDESAARAKGGKRSPEDLAKLTQLLLAYVKKNPGKRIEEIGKALNTNTKELKLPVAKLLADKWIGKKGEKRSTAYYPKG